MFRGADKKLDWEKIIWTSLPIVLGAVVAFTVGGTKFTSDSSMIAFLVGWSVGYVLQLAATEERLVHESAQVRGDVGDSLELARILLDDTNKFSGSLKQIVEVSASFQTDTEHLPLGLQKTVHKWISVYLNGVLSEAQGFSGNSKYFQEDQGMDVDLELVKSASGILKASTHVSAESTYFWTKSPPGRKYRSACVEKAKELGAGVLDANDEIVSGSARLFSIDKKIIERRGENPQAKLMLDSILAEARSQSDDGILVRILHQADVLKKESAKLDVLIVDNKISSKTVAHDSHDGVARNIEVSWNQSSVRSIANDWNSLWGRGSSVDEFCEIHGIEV